MVSLVAMPLLFWTVFMVIVATNLNQVTADKDLKHSQSSGTRKHLDAFLLIRAYNSVVDAGKALAEIIQNQELYDKENVKRSEDIGDLEFMRFG